MKNITFVSFVLLIILSTNYNFAQWQPTGLTTGGVSHIASNSTAIIVHNTGLKYSTDSGINWQSMNYSSTMALTANEEAVYVSGASQPHVSKTTNMGISWTQYWVSAADGIFSLHTSGNNVYAGTIHYGVRRSKDNGNSWGVVSFPFGTVNSIFAIGSNVYTALEDWGLSVSTNNGGNWSSLYLSQEFVNTIHSNGSHVFAGTKTGGIFISSDNGSSWMQSSLININVTAITSSGNNIFVGSTNSGVYFSGNNGTSWQQVNTGLTNLNIRALHIHNQIIYAGTSGAGLWKRDITEIVGIETITNEIPKGFSLMQNYPNPFNPTTSIRFSALKSSNVNITVYNSAGKEITTLVNMQMNAGVYKAEFNAAESPSGIYFCKMTAGDISSVIKMVLVK
jgi:hypothetical protein